MANEVVGIDLEVRLDKMRQELASMGPEVAKAARSNLAALSAEVKEARKAMDASTKAMKAGAMDGAGGLKAMEQQTAKAKEAFASLQTGLGMINPQLGQMAAQAGAAGGAVKAALSSLGMMGSLAPIAAAALLGVGVAYLAISTEAKKAEEAVKAAAVEASIAQRVYEGLVPTLEEVEQEYAILAGTTDKDTEAAKRRQDRIRAAGEQEKRLADARIEDTRKAAAALQVQIEFQERAMKGAIGGDATRRAALLEDYRAQEQALTTTLEQQERVRAGIDARVNEGVRKAGVVLQAAKADKDIAQEAAQAARDKAEADRRASLAAQERAQREAELAGALQEQTALQRDLALRGATDEQRRIAQLEEELARIDALVLKTGDLAAAEAMRAAAVRSSDEEIARIRAEEQARRAAEMARQDEERAAAEAAFDAIDQARAERRLQQEQDIASARIALGQASFGFISDLSSAMSGRSEKSARRWFAVSKAAAYGVAVVNALAAGSRAFADYPFPLSIVMAALAGASALTQAAGIKSTSASFYRGLSRPDYQPEEYQATMHREERILNARTRDLISDEAVQQLNAGQSPGMSSVSYVILDGKDISASVQADESRSGRLRAAMGSIRKVGRHSDRS